MKLTLYRGGEKIIIPAIDFSPAWAAQGWSTEPSAQPATPADTAPEAIANDQPIPHALQVINQANNPRELLPLPGIGQGAAKRIYDKRPPDGYRAIAHIAELSPELNRNPFDIDWAAVEGWTLD